MTIGIVGLPHYFPDGFFIDTTMENDYSVYDHITPDGMHYYGTTNNIKRRWGYNGIYYKGTTLQPYIEKYGWQNIQHIVLFETLSKEDALSIEDSLIVSGWEKENCINQRRSGYVSKEEGYHREYQRSDYQREYQREYQQTYQREYYQKNREKRLEQRREHYQKNRDEINERRRQRNQRKKQESQLKELGYIPLF